MDNKITTFLYYFVSVCFYIVAIIKFMDSGVSSGVVWLCLGSAFLCLGSANLNKNRKSDNNDDNEKKH